MYAKELWIVVIEGGPGGTDMTTKSALGLFEKYSKDTRSATTRVVWKKISSGGQLSEVNRWERQGQVPSTAQTTATGTLVNVGLYIVAHGQEGSGQIAGAGPSTMIAKLGTAGIPRADKVSFVACYSGQQDEGAIGDTRFRDYDPTAHGLDVQDLSFISMFAVGYQTAYGSTDPLHVAGWESFVSAYHPTKTENAPTVATTDHASHTGRKYVQGVSSSGYTFMKPKSSSRKDKKRMFRWTFVDGSAKVEKIGLDDWKKSA
ncbi:hypothetical protein QFZ83_001078 [Variovorax sp. W1I1]|nr:hypothetical protein [Variovorax sp. W1I1]